MNDTDDTTTIELEPTECALISHNDMEDLELRIPNPEHQGSENGDTEGYSVPGLMAYLAACYYRWNHDPEFVRQQMDWCDEHLQDTLGRDIEDKLASRDDGLGDGFNSATSARH
jgi:hypothetical protein